MSFIFGPSTYVLVCWYEKCISSFSAFVLTTGDILFRLMPHASCLFSSTSLSSLVKDNSLADWCMNLE